MMKCTNKEVGHRALPRRQSIRRKVQSGWGKKKKKKKKGEKRKARDTTFGKRDMRRVTENRRQRTERGETGQNVQAAS